MNKLKMSSQAGDDIFYYLSFSKTVSNISGKSE